MPFAPALLLAAEAAASLTPAAAVALRPAVPANYPGNWATTNDYPVRALHNMEQGATGYSLTVTPEGLVGSCLVTESSGSIDLDEATCRLVSDRARFVPATDTRGAPTEGAYASRVHWLLPTAKAALQPGSLKFSFTVEPDGTKSACQVGVAEGAPVANQPVGEVPCTMIPFNGRYTDANGQGLRRRVTITQTVKVEEVK
jgi:TonB family protein